MFTPITRFFVCIFWNAVRNHRISMFTPITRFLVCICRLCASTPVNGHKLSVAVYDTGPLTLNSVHYYYQDSAFQSYRPRTIKAIQNNKGYSNNNSVINIFRNHLLAHAISTPGAVSATLCPSLPLTCRARYSTPCNPPCPL